MNINFNYYRKPKFNCDQIVSFIGGEGKITNIQRQDNCWAYIIEMTMGAKPDFGRIGAETTIVLAEQDISQADKKLN
jgi:hypothetical protein